MAVAFMQESRYVGKPLYRRCRHDHIPFPSLTLYPSLGIFHHVFLFRSYTERSRLGYVNKCSEARLDKP